MMGDAVNRRDFLKTGSAGLTVSLAAGRVMAAAATEVPKPLRVGFIGTGGRGTGLLRSTLGLPGLSVVAICDTNPGNRERAVGIVAEKQGAKPDALGDDKFSYRALLERDDIDCLVLATPCNWHSRMYVDCLEAEKPFYGEKPLAITAKGVKWLQETRAKHPDVVMQLGFQWGSHLGRADAVKQVHDGAIGTLLEGRFHRYNGWGSLGRWLNDRKLSGDWMLEQAVHEFNLMWWVIQDHPATAYTVGRSHLVEPNNEARDVTDFYTAILEYESGLVVHYTHGWIDPPTFGGMSTRFIGTTGGIDVLDGVLRLRDKEPIRGEGPGGDTPEHLQNLFDAVRAGDPKLCHTGFENGVQASYVGLMVRTALDAKRVVTFEEMLADPTDLPPLV